MTLTARFYDQLNEFLTSERRLAHQILHELQNRDHKLLLRSDLQDLIADIEEAGEVPIRNPLIQAMSWTQEGALKGNSLYLAVRSAIARWGYLKIHRLFLLLSRYFEGDFGGHKFLVLNILDTSAFPDNWHQSN